MSSRGSGHSGGKELSTSGHELSPPCPSSPEQTGGGATPGTPLSSADDALEDELIFLSLQTPPASGATGRERLERWGSNPKSPRKRPSNPIARLMARGDVDSERLSSTSSHPDPSPVAKRQRRHNAARRGQHWACPESDDSDEEAEAEPARMAGGDGASDASVAACAAAAATCPIGGGGGWGGGASLSSYSEWRAIPILSSSARSESTSARDTPLATSPATPPATPPLCARSSDGFDGPNCPLSPITATVARIQQTLTLSPSARGGGSGGGMHVSGDDVSCPSLPAPLHRATRVPPAGREPPP